MLSVKHRVCDQEVVGSSLYQARDVKTLGKFLTSYTSGPVSTEMGDRVRVQFPVPDIQSINLFSQLCNNKNECQQNNVKHNDGLPEKQIAHLSWSPK